MVLKLYLAWGCPMSQVSLGTEPSSNQSEGISTVNCSCCGCSLNRAGLAVNCDCCCCSMTRTEQGWALTFRNSHHFKVALGVRYTHYWVADLLSCLYSDILFWVNTVKWKPLTNRGKRLLHSLTTFIKTDLELTSKCFSPVTQGHLGLFYCLW